MSAQLTERKLLHEVDPERSRGITPVPLVLLVIQP